MSYVGRSCHTQALRSDFQREHLARNDPGRCVFVSELSSSTSGSIAKQRTGSPSGSEEGDEHADERELRCRTCVVALGCRRAACSNDVLRDTHAQRADEEHRASAEAINGVEAREGGDDVDDVGNDLQDESAGKAIDGRKISCPVVEDKIYTSLGRVSSGSSRR